MKSLIRCVNCDEVFCRTSFDQWPEYQLDPTIYPDPFRENPRDDLQQFQRTHHGHQLEELEAVEESGISETPYVEPMKVSYFKATNGKEEFTIRKYRENIMEPLKYQLIHGDFHLQFIRFEVQSKEIDQTLRLDCPGLSSEKRKRFVRKIEETAQRLEVKGLERISYETSHPLEVFYRMNDVSIVFLLKDLRASFLGSEYSLLKDFIYRHREDTFLLKGIHRIAISPAVESQANVAASTLSSERRISKRP